MRIIGLGHQRQRVAGDRCARMTGILLLCAGRLRKGKPSRTTHPELCCSTFVFLRAFRWAVVLFDLASPLSNLLL